MDDVRNIAVFVDFENIAIGARDAKFDDFDIDLALERMLDKGKVVVKKAYCDWERYKSQKKKMHEAAFELIEIPHVSYSGKNSADIRLVVDALDLCYTKAHVDTFAILSGDSDFSPLVSKLRENNKKVIGMGVKSSTSDLLVENCDEFIYYDDVVRKKQGQRRATEHSRKAAARRPERKKAEAQVTPVTSTTLAAPSVPPSVELEAPARDDAPAKDEAQKDKEEALKDEALEMVLDVVESLFQERDGNLWGSMVKQTLKRRKPNFDETAHGFRTFTQLLEDAKRRGLLEIHKDEKSGGYLISGFGPKA